MTDQAARAQRGLEARVARVNSKTQLVLNVGRVNGVKSGDTFRLMSKDGIPINDPETGEKIGHIPVEKARVKVETVYEKICIVGTYRTYTVGGNSLGGLFGPEREVKEEMDAEVSQEYDIDMTVRVGDKATLINLASS